MKDLYLALKGEYFNQIKRGEKPEEFRLFNDYWKKRLVGKEYACIVLTLGYPKKDDHSRRIVREYRGYEVRTIQHKEFGDSLVKVFAIKLT